MSITQTFKEVFATVNALANAEEKSKLIGLLFAAREQSFALQEEKFALREENRELKEQIESYDQFDKKMLDYHLVQVGNCPVYQHKINHMILVCPHCVECLKFHFLNPSDMIGHSHICPSCHNGFALSAADLANSTPVSSKCPPPGG